MKLLKLIPNFECRVLTSGLVKPRPNSGYPWLGSIEKWCQHENVTFALKSVKQRPNFRYLDFGIGFEIKKWNCPCLLFPLDYYWNTYFEAVACNNFFLFFLFSFSLNFIVLIQIFPIMVWSLERERKKYFKTQWKLLDIFCFVF